MTKAQAEQEALAITKIALAANAPNLHKTSARDVADFIKELTARLSAADSGEA